MSYNKLSNLRLIIQQIIEEAKNEISPESIINKHVERINNFLYVSDLNGYKKKYDLINYDKILILGAGKVSHRMAAVIEKIFFDKDLSGLVVTKRVDSLSLEKVKVVEAGHPVPDKRSMKYAKEILTMVKNADTKTLVLFLISGGGSSLLSYPVRGIKFDEKIKITKLLLCSGATIEELNTFRKYFSLVKGGGILNYAKSQIISLIISDVIENPISVIASAPTYWSKPSPDDVGQLLKKYNLLRKLSTSTKNQLEKNIWEGKQPSRQADNFILFDNKSFCEYISKIATRQKLNVFTIDRFIDGDIVDASKMLIKNYRKIYSQVADQTGLYLIISGGEPTVKVSGKGIGGRNHELSLLMIQFVSKFKSAVFLSLATDGDDGNSGNAGAIVDSETLVRLKKSGLDYKKFLYENDSFTLFNKINSLFHFPKGLTNVMDIQLFLFEIE